MRFYMEPEIKEGQLHPACYRLHVAGSGRYHGLIGVITDAELADLIVNLLNAEECRKDGPRPPPQDWKLGDKVPD